VIEGLRDRAGFDCAHRGGSLLPHLWVIREAPRRIRRAAAPEPPEEVDDG
jgi:hypothetical protein